MNSLALNFTISERLRRSISIGLGVLPLGLMFSSFLVLWPFAKWSSAAFGIPDGAPVKDQANGLIWLATFLTVMVALMLLGYVLGWLLNALICRFVLGWPAERVRKTFLESEVPVEWLKQPDPRSPVTQNISPKWAEIRIKGQFHFVLTRGVAAWGIPMYMVMGVIPGLRTHKAILYFLWQGLVWAAAGALFGFVVWYFSETSYLKNVQKKP